MREFWREKRSQKVNKAEDGRKKESYRLKPKDPTRRALRDFNHCRSSSGNQEVWLDSGSPDQEEDQGFACEESWTKQTKTQGQNLSHSPKTLPHRFRGQIQTTIPLNRVGIANVDPFSRLVLGEGPEMQKLLHHCKLLNFPLLPIESSLWKYQTNGNKKRLLDNSIKHG